MVFQQTVQSLVDIGWGNKVDVAKQAHGFTEIGFYWAKNYPRVDAMRDSAVDFARREGFTHVLFLDADMIWPSDLLVRMLRHAADPLAIVCGLYVMRGEPYSPVAMTGRFRDEGSQVDQFFHVLEYATDIVEVDVVGMGCCLIPLAVLDAIGPRPWFEYKNDDQGWPAVTEDVPFCLKAKDAGYHVYLDPTVQCGHIDTMIRDERFHKRYQESLAATNRRMPFTLELGAPRAAAIHEPEDAEFPRVDLVVTNAVRVDG